MWLFWVQGWGLYDSLDVGGQGEVQCGFDRPKVETGTWYPNYGEWRKEWNYLSDTFGLPEMKQCLTTEWEYTDCFFGGSNEMPMSKRTTLKQPYVRVDKKKLKSLFLNRFKSSGNGITVEVK